VRNIASVTTGVAEGDLSRKITADAQGEVLDLKQTINVMVDQLNGFASEVSRVAREVGTEGKLGGQAEVPGALGIWKGLTDNVNNMASNLTDQVRNIASVTTGVAEGDLSRKITADAQGEVLDLKQTINVMVDQLRETTRQNSETVWLKTNLAELTRNMQTHSDPTELSKMLLSELAHLIDAQHGIFYLMDETVADDPCLRLLSDYAAKKGKNFASEWRIGEGLVGQCAYEKQCIKLTTVPSGYIEITSGLGGAEPQNILLQPIMYENKVKAVIEVASFTTFSQIRQTFLEQLGESIGTVLHAIEVNRRTGDLLTQSQTFSEELRTRGEELRLSNAELKENARLLADQKVEVERKNTEIEAAKRTLEVKATELAITSQYKSEFLSSMSHELRTPLNSLLMLAQLLAENTERNMSDQQIEYAEIIQDAGKNLLALIGDILDLAKIESGSSVPDLEDILFGDLSADVKRTFGVEAASLDLGFGVELAPELPASIHTDPRRLQQVMKNLLSNAFKFTPQGQVSVRIAPVESGWSNDHDGLNSALVVIGFFVTDTGIGLPADKQKLIFESFQQADAGTARMYGGTGLGLSISREIAQLLSGELRLVESSPGQGSTFVLYLPLSGPELGQDSRGVLEVDLASGHHMERDGEPSTPNAARPHPQAQDVPQRIIPQEQIKPRTAATDDRETVKSGDSTLLIVEDDALFAEILLRAARDIGFKGIVAGRGDDGLQLADVFRPTAITLDLVLPDMDGWAVLDRLKRNPDTRHIPINIISARDKRVRGLFFGAFEYLAKPITAGALHKALGDLNNFAERKVKNLLVVDCDEQHRNNVVDHVGNHDVRVTAVSSGQDALDALEKERYDCIVLDNKLSDMSVADLLEGIQGFDPTHNVPVILCSSAEAPHQEQARLESLARKGTFKEVRTTEQLLNETSLFLHRVVSKLPEDQRQMLKNVDLRPDNLAGKKVLVVDDDVLNVFAIAAVLERREMTVLCAHSGSAALEELETNPDVDIVLMDIMMPGMDGYEAINQIRQIKQFQSLPIIAHTANAMKGDREKCLAAGATDYISKPVETDHLVSVLRVQLESERAPDPGPAESA
jgi:CheY-like chemotaxis protein/signal transduction histidine kinase/HAMP domain-containing protein